MGYMQGQKVSLAHRQCDSASLQLEAGSRQGSDEAYSRVDAGKSLIIPDIVKCDEQCLFNVEHEVQRVAASLACIRSVKSRFHVPKPMNMYYAYHAHQNFLL